MRIICTLVTVVAACNAVLASTWFTKAGEYPVSRSRSRQNMIASSIGMEEGDVPIGEESLTTYGSL